MEISQIKRINELAKKAKLIGLSDEEKNEQQQLRKKYIEEWRKGVEQTLDNTYISDGTTKRKLKKKEETTTEE